MTFRQDPFAQLSDCSGVHYKLVIRGTSTADDNITNFTSGTVLCCE